MDKFHSHDSDNYKISTGDYNEYFGGTNYKFQKYCCMLGPDKIYTYLGILEMCGMPLDEFEKFVINNFNAVLYRRSTTNIWLDTDKDMQECKEWLESILVMNFLVQK